MWILLAVDFEWNLSRVKEKERKINVRIYTINHTGYDTRNGIISKIIGKMG